MDRTFPSTGQTLSSTALTPDQMQALFQQLTSDVLGFACNLPFDATLNGTDTITVASTTGMQPGFEITDAPGYGLNGYGLQGYGADALIPDGTKILSIDGLNVKLSAAVTGSGARTVFVTDPMSNTSVRTAWQQQGAPAWGIDDDVCFVRCVEVENPYNEIRDEGLQQNDDGSTSTVREYTRVWRVFWSIYGPDSVDNARLIKSALLLDVATVPLAGVSLYVVPAMPTPQYLKEEKDGQWWPRTVFEADFNEEVIETITTPTVESVEVIVESYRGVELDIVVKKN